MVWHIGNTTVRTPYRLRPALVVLSTSHLRGNLLGQGNEQAFADLLDDSGVVRAIRRRQSATADRSDLGRKWRVALAQLGFVVHHITRGHRSGIDRKLVNAVDGIPSLTGHPYEITPAGQLFIDADDILTQQESFLRALAAYRIPSPLERRYRHGQFSPLHFTLEIFRSLDTLGLEPFISFEEMALIVQRNTADDGAAHVADSIWEWRVARENARGQLILLNSGAYEKAVRMDDSSIPASQINSRARTLNDYADLNIRYLKATGLFKSKGRGITLSPERHEIVRRLTDQPLVTLDDDSYLRQLWQGAALPTDERETAVSVVRSLGQAALQKGAESEEIDFASLDDAQLQMVRRRLEARLLRLNEQQFAAQQIHRVDEIVGFMDAILARRRRVPYEGTAISIPTAEYAVYLEWVIWRAFLAINSLQNMPWEARRFQIDQDLLPVGHAPGGGPDMSFTFEDAIVVVEVTLTSSSRQEAAEGEPVRRHVAKYAEEYATTKKAVYGLFIAPKVDTNTAHTFRSGDWYRADDSKINVHIVPMELSDFRDLFRAILVNQQESPRRLRELLTKCRMEAIQEAPLWKKTVSELTQRTVEELTC